MESKHSIQELTLEEVMVTVLAAIQNILFKREQDIRDGLEAGSTSHFIRYEQRRKHV